MLGVSDKPLFYDESGVGTEELGGERAGDHEPRSTRVSEEEDVLFVVGDERAIGAEWDHEIVGRGHVVGEDRVGLLFRGIRKEKPDRSAERVDSIREHTWATGLGEHGVSRNRDTFTAGEGSGRGDVHVVDATEAGEDEKGTGVELAVGK